MPYDVAATIAGEHYPASPHLTAALQLEWYAASLPPAVPVGSVSTGVQSVSYNPAAIPGDTGAALERARWHRSFIKGGVVSVPATVSTDYVWVDFWGYGTLGDYPNDTPVPLIPRAPLP
jgi:hypothetical protein